MTGIYYIDMAIGLFIVAVLLVILVARLHPDDKG
jgi:hypothetical protein